MKEFLLHCSVFFFHQNDKACGMKVQFHSGVGGGGVHARLQSFDIESCDILKRSQNGTFPLVTVLKNPDKYT